MMEVRKKRKDLGVVPAFKRVDTCAAEFEAATPYMYSSYDGTCECDPSSDKKARTPVDNEGACCLQRWITALYSSL